MKKQFTLCTVLCILSLCVWSAPIASIASGNWDNPATWSGGVVPVAGDDVTISNGHTVTITADAACASISVGSGALSLSTTLTVNAGILLTVSGDITIVPPLTNNRDNTLNVNDGVISCASLHTSNSAGNSRRCMVNIGAGTLSCASDFLMGNNATRNKLVFSGPGILQISGNSSTIANGQFTASTGTIDYNGTVAQNILALSYYHLKCSGSNIKSLSANTVVAGSLSIAGAAQLDVTAVNNYSLSVAGNWDITSTDADPFLERAATVTFNGASGLQTISTPLSQETFYNLTINNNAGNSGADVEFNKNCYVSQTYNHTSGKVDLKGNSLNVISQNNTGSFITCNLTGGSIISSTPGASVSFSDANDSTYVNFSGTDVGNSIVSVRLTINTGRINIENLTLYGQGDFTKTYALDDGSSIGGNKYYGNVTFTAASTASRWRMSTGIGALPDSFFAKAVFNAYANGGTNNNFIIGANSVGNYYADSVWFTSTTVGGLFIGRSNGSTGVTSSHTFNGHVEVMVTHTGNITFADGASTDPSTVTFNKTLKLNSTSTSTGDIYIGKNNTSSFVTISSTGQLTDGTVTGATNIYFYNVTQNGTLSQSTTNAGSSNSNITVGSSIAPCTWNGPLNLIAPNINLAYSTFNGSTNGFSMNGLTNNQSCTGGNTFAAGTTTYFTNSGTMNWYLANTAPDDYNGNVVYARSSTAGIFPAYNTNCTYAGNISILNYSDSIVFAGNTNGRITIDGSSNTFFSNTSSKLSTCKRLTINKSSGNFTLNKSITVPAGGDVSLVSGRIITSSAAMLCLLDENCTVTSATQASTSYIDGPLRYDVTNNAPLTIHFPIGKGNDCRPTSLSITHTSNTSYTYIAEVFNASANALGWALPSTSMNNVSIAHYWDIERYTTSTMAVTPTTGLSGNQTVTLHYGANDNVTDATAVTVCKNTYTATTSWVDIGATGATVTSGSISSTSSPTAFNSFSRFTLGFYGIPAAPTATDGSRCGTGAVTISATGLGGESIDWYAAASGGTALLTNSETYTTPSISTTTIYYAEARNTHGTVSATRTAVTATVNNTPTVSTFAPSGGTIGQSIVITGTGFSTATAVSFGGTPAGSFTINSATQITAVLAGGASGLVSVTNNCGTGSLAGFAYNYITVWTGASNNSWANAANWSNGVPNNLYTTVIANVATPPLVSSNQTVKTLTINSNASLDVAVGNTVSVADSFANNGTITGGGSIALNGTASQQLSGNGTLNNLILNNSNGAVVSNTGGTMLNITGRYTPTSGVLTTNGHVTLKSDASGTATIAAGTGGGNYISGKMILERYVPGRRAWRLISFPVSSTGAPTINAALQEGAGGNASSNPSPGYGTHITGGTIANGFDQSPSNNTSMKELVSGAWQGIASTNQAITNQSAYFLFVRGSRANNLNQGVYAAVDNTVLRIDANVKQGNQSISLSGAGWVLVGNPFPSKINLDNIAISNSSLVNRNFVFWDPKLGGSNNVGGFVTASYNGAGYDYTPTPVSSLSEYAQPFSAFYVDAVAAGSLAINETHKCNCGTDNVFRPAPAQPTGKLRVLLHSINADGTTPVVDGTMAAFAERYSNGADNFDAIKLPSTVSENISVIKNQKKFAIERRNALAVADTVYLNMAGMKEKAYNFEIIPEGFDASVTAYLEDSYTNARVALSIAEASFYKFKVINSPAAYAPNRFRIVLQKEKNNFANKPKAPIENTVAANKGIQLLQNPVANNTLRLDVKALDKGNYTIVISTQDGKQVASQQFAHNGIDGIKSISINEILPAMWLTATIEGSNGYRVTLKILPQ